MSDLERAPVAISPDGARDRAHNIYIYILSMYDEYVFGIRVVIISYCIRVLLYSEPLP